MHTKPESAGTSSALPPLLVNISVSPSPRVHPPADTPGCSVARNSMASAWASSDAMQAVASGAVAHGRTIVSVVRSGIATRDLFFAGRKVLTEMKRDLTFVYSYDVQRQSVVLHRVSSLSDYCLSYFKVLPPITQHCQCHE